MIDTLNTKRRLGNQPSFFMNVFWQKSKFTATAWIKINNH